MFHDNVFNKYHDAGDAVSSDEETESEYNLGGKPKYGYITTDIYTSFTILVGIFFPSCTGKKSECTFMKRMIFSFLYILH